MEPTTGIQNWVDEGCFDPDLPDLFLADESRLHFPCNGCLHNEDDESHCRGCRHWCD